MNKGFLGWKIALWMNVIVFWLSAMLLLGEIKLFKLKHDAFNPTTLEFSATMLAYQSFVLLYVVLCILYEAQNNARNTAEAPEKVGGASDTRPDPS